MPLWRWKDRVKEYVSERVVRGNGLEWARRECMDKERWKSVCCGHTPWGTLLEGPRRRSYRLADWYGIVMILRGQKRGSCTAMAKNEKKDIRGRLGMWLSPLGKHGSSYTIIKSRKEKSRYYCQQHHVPVLVKERTWGWEEDRECPNKKYTITDNKSWKKKKCWGNFHYITPLASEHVYSLL